MKITLSHGSGGKATSELIEKIFSKHFSNPILDMMEDSAVVDSSKKIAITTDSFVVTPLFFKGGDIGRLAVCGTVNDLLMRGAKAKYITSAFIIEEGADTETIEKIVKSMAQTAKEADVIVVAGDTKVIEGNGGVYINTTGIGFADNDKIVSSNLQDNDAVIVSGTMGDHHSTILSARMNIENNISSDNAPLCEIVYSLLGNNIDVHCMRDITRGGLGTVLNEIADSSGVNIEIEESKIPVNESVKAFSKILGLNILHMGNEGKLVAFVPMEQAEKTLEIIKKCKYGENAQIIGKVNKDGSGVTIITPIGGRRKVNILIGEGLPRIC